MFETMATGLAMHNDAAPRRALVTLGTLARGTTPSRQCRSRRACRSTRRRDDAGSRKHRSGCTAERRSLPGGPARESRVLADKEGDPTQHTQVDRLILESSRSNGWFLRARCRVSLHWLIAISLAFVLLEAARPGRKGCSSGPASCADPGLPGAQRASRCRCSPRASGWFAASRAGHGVFLQRAGVVLPGGAHRRLAARGHRLRPSHVRQQWCVHNSAAPRALALEGRMQHHAIITMDFVGNFRFH